MTSILAQHIVNIYYNRCLWKLTIRSRIKVHYQASPRAFQLHTASCETWYSIKRSSLMSLETVDFVCSKLNVRPRPLLKLSGKQERQWSCLKMVEYWIFTTDWEIRKKRGNLCKQVTIWFRISVKSGANHEAKKCRNNANANLFRRWSENPSSPPLRNFSYLGIYPQYIVFNS